MIRIVMESFTEQYWTKVFVAYRSVNQCHWKMPLFGEVITALRQQGMFSFAGGKSSRLELRVHSLEVQIEFVPTVRKGTLVYDELLRMQAAFEQRATSRP